MYKVLLADDEAWVLESLKTIIDWEACGYKIIGAAYNGIEALQMILELAPDIVLTDIRMPDMNGLEMIKKVNDLRLDVLFIIASGYAEFAYVQKAMSFGAIGYCLKPFDDTEIKNSLDKAAARLKKKRESARPDILELIEEADDGDTTALLRQLKDYGLDAAAGRLSVLASIGRGTLELWEGAQYAALRVGALKKLYLVQDELPTDKKRFLEKQLSEDIISIGAGRPVSDASKLKEAISEAVCCCYDYFITGKTGFFEARDIPIHPLNELLKKLKTAVSDKDITAISDIIRQMKSLFEERIYGIKAAHQVYTMAVSYVFEYIEAGNEVYIESFEQLAGAFENIGAMLDSLERLILDSIGVRQNLFSGEVRNETVKELIDYVNSSFNKEISVQSLSTKFFINPNYISRVFKKEVGQNLIEYLTKLRLDYASRLLRETRLSVQQISEKAGYNDYFYFTRIFKKATGKTPSQYRNG